MHSRQTSSNCWLTSQETNPRLLRCPYSTSDPSIESDEYNNLQKLILNYQTKMQIFLVKFLNIPFLLLED